MQSSNLKTTSQEKIQKEISGFIQNRKSLQLSSINQEGRPYASYAPFAAEGNAIYVLLSEIALHAVNLKTNPQASILIIEDEDSAQELFARLRINYHVQAQHLEVNSTAWQQGIEALSQRHGERIHNLSSLADFNLFKLIPQGGRYIKGFGKAYTIEGNSLTGLSINHLREGHKKRDVA